MCKIADRSSQPINDVFIALYAYKFLVLNFLSSSLIYRNWYGQAQVSFSFQQAVGNLYPYGGKQSAGRKSPDEEHISPWESNVQSTTVL